MRSGPELKEALDLLKAGEREALETRWDAPTVRVLEEIAEARRLVREGRIEEFVDRCRAVRRVAPSDRSWLLMYAGSLLQAAFRFTGDLALRIEALDALGAVADRVDEPTAAVPARAMMGSVHMLEGRFHPAIELCDAGLDLARAHGLETRPPSALAHQFRGYVLFEWNRLAEAETSLLRAWEASEEGSAGVRTGVARILARICDATGRASDAESWLRRLEALRPEPLSLRNREWLAAVRLRRRLERGDVRALDDWLRRWTYTADELAEADDAHLASRLGELETALALLEAAGRWDDVLRLAPMIHRASRGRRHWFDARALAAWAAALEGTGRPGDAGARFARALEVSTVGSFVRALTDGSPYRLRVLDRLARESGSEEAERVLRGSGADRGARDILTARQLDVLRRIERGLSTKAIAQDLGLSPNTIKTHTRALFKRLGAHSRTEAVALAREGGWL